MTVYTTEILDVIASNIRDMENCLEGYEHQLETAERRYSRLAKASRHAWDSIQGLRRVDEVRYSVPEYRAMADRAVRQYKRVTRLRDTIDSLRVRIASEQYLIDVQCDGDLRD
jgi:uncharacterized FlgJ-related protein